MFWMWQERRFAKRVRVRPRGLKTSKATSLQIASFPLYFCRTLRLNALQFLDPSGSCHRPKQSVDILVPRTCCTVWTPFLLHYFTVSALTRSSTFPPYLKCSITANVNNCCKICLTLSLVMATMTTTTRHPSILHPILSGLLPPLSGSIIEKH